MLMKDLLVILPLLIVIGWAMVLLLVDLLIPAHHKRITAFLAAVGLAVALVITIILPAEGITAFNGMLRSDGFARYLNILFLGSGIAGIGLAHGYLKRMGIERGEYYTLLLFTISGMMTMSYAVDLIMIFLALELLSIPLYVMAGFARPQLASEEASLKYFLLGAFASGFVLFGIALVFGATAHTSLSGIQESIRAGTANNMLLLMGGALLLVGFGFKVAAVPFHMWTPDVYQGSPSPVTGFMSVGAKVAGFTALLRVFSLVFRDQAGSFIPVLWSLAVLTMFIGNLLAMSQTNIKRLLAYSSIAHAGYILMAFVPFWQGILNPSPITAILFYLAVYAVTSFGIWAFVIMLEKAEGGGLDLDNYSGLGRKNPMMAVCMLIFLLSFIGIPPLLGFWGKLYLFQTAVAGGYTSLAVIGIITSLFSAYYYLRIVYFMFMRTGDPVIYRETWAMTIMVAAAAIIILLGFLPGIAFQLANLPPIL
jgi:NADH-quinone oxidoreductase subunit N